MLTLEEVVKSFEYWRNKRKSKKERIPTELWSMAKELVPYYNKATIQKALRISGGHFNKYCTPIDSDTAVPSAEDNFASGVFNHFHHPHNEICELTLSGRCNNLTIKTSVHSVSQILPLIERYL